MQEKYYLINIELIDVKPKVWRDFVVPADISLDRLHDIIQIVMGWQDEHLHEFNFGNKRYVEVVDEEFDDDATFLESSVRLNKHFKKKGDSCIYVYDFGDSWEHRLTLLNSKYQPEEDELQICCLDGEGACPLEDIGGPPGYAEFLKAIKSKKHKDHDMLVAMTTGLQPTGKQFDPSWFDVDMIEDTLYWYTRWSRPRKLEWKGA